MSLDARSVSAVLLLVSAVVDVTSNLMWNVRNRTPGFRSGPAYLAWERGILIAAYGLAALGTAGLEVVLNQAGALLLPRLASSAFLAAAVIAIVVESGFLTGREVTPGLVYVMVAALFTAEALISGALLSTSAMPAWVGWTALAWNIGWPVALVILSPRDFYYPVLHFVTPLLAGIVLLATH